MRRRIRILAVLLAMATTSAAADARADTIVGGQETTRTWSFMVFIEQGRQELDLFDLQYCAGSLIAPTWVLTAGHCIDNQALDPLTTTVVIGRHAISGSDGERIQAKRVIQHPGYTSTGEDLSLIELERAPKGNPAPIKIAGPGEENVWAPGVMATILGWGATSSGGNGSDVLKEAQVPVVPDADCVKAYSELRGAEVKPDFEVCAGYLGTGETDTCQGDSGGPMLATAPDGSLRQIGVTSRGEGCAEPKYPGVYARVGGPRLRTFIAKYVPGAISTAPAPPAPVAPIASQPSGSGSAPAPSGSSQPKPGTQRKKKDPCARYRKAKTRKGKAKLRACIKRARKRR